MSPVKLYVPVPHSDGVVDRELLVQLYPARHCDPHCDIVSRSVDWEPLLCIHASDIQHTVESHDNLDQH